MKKIFTLFVAFIFFNSLNAQQTDAPGSKKYDTIMMKGGEMKIGSVTDINDDVIGFVYKGETLNYSLKKNDVVKIIFSSGRVEMYNDPSTTKDTSSSSKEDHHNKAAVLPFSYINNQQGEDQAMGYKIQSECYTFLSSKAVSLN